MISTLEQFRRMGPTEFKGSSDPLEAYVHADVVRENI